MSDLTLAALDDLISNVSTLWESPEWRRAAVMATMEDLPKLAARLDQAAGSLARAREVLLENQATKPLPADQEAPRATGHCLFCGVALPATRRTWCTDHDPKGNPFPGASNLRKRRNGEELYLAELRKRSAPERSTSGPAPVDVNFAQHPLAKTESGVAGWAAYAHELADARAKHQRLVTLSPYAEAAMEAGQALPAEVERTPFPDFRKEDLVTLASLEVPEDKVVSPRFPALAEGGEKVWVRAVLDRTVVVEPWPQDAGGDRRVVRKDQLKVDPATIILQPANLAALDLRSASRRGRKNSTGTRRSA